MGNVETMVAIGDSVVWGQGLRHDDKFASQVYEALSDGRLLDERAIKAHSGAVIGAQHWGPSAPPFAYEIPGVEQAYGPVGTRTGRHEKPSDGPTILQQLDRLPYDYLRHDGPGLEREADRAYDDEADVDLVLLDGGINDLGAFSIALDLSDRTGLAREISQRCFTDLSLLIERTRRKFPNAIVVVTSYFPYVSRESSLNLRKITDTAAVLFGVALGIPFGVAVGLVAGLLTGVTGRIARRRIMDNVAFFNRHQLAAVRRAVTEANRRLDGPGIVFASPRFRAKNSANAPEAWLWPLRDGAIPTGSTGNPGIAAQRRVVCDATGGGIVCANAASAHPNPDGADAYTRAIVERFRDHTDSRVREPVTRLRGGSAGEPVSVREQVERHGFDAGRGLRSELAHTTVDSLTIEFESRVRGPSSVTTVDLAGKTFPIDIDVRTIAPDRFSPRRVERFPIDPAISLDRPPENPLRLWEFDDVVIRREVLRTGPGLPTDPGRDGRPDGVGWRDPLRIDWEIDRVTLRINGSPVYEDYDRRLDDSQALTLPYPSVAG